MLDYEFSGIALELCIGHSLQRVSYIRIHFVRLRLVLGPAPGLALSRVVHGVNVSIDKFPIHQVATVGPAGRSCRSRSRYSAAMARLRKGLSGDQLTVAGSTFPISLTSRSPVIHGRSLARWA